MDGKEHAVGGWGRPRGNGHRGRRTRVQTEPRLDFSAALHEPSWSSSPPRFPGLPPTSLALPPFSPLPQGRFKKMAQHVASLLKARPQLPRTLSKSRSPDHGHGVFPDPPFMASPPPASPTQLLAGCGPHRAHPASGLSCHRRESSSRQALALPHSTQAPLNCHPSPQGSPPPRSLHLTHCFSLYKPKPPTAASQTDVIISCLAVWFSCIPGPQNRAWLPEGPPYTPGTSGLPEASCPLSALLLSLLPMNSQQNFPQGRDVLQCEPSISTWGH